MGLLRDRRAEFEAAGVRVVGISRDSPYSHAAWAEVLELGFPLLSDWNGEATEGFGVALEDFGGLRGVSARTAFLVETDGTVTCAWRYGLSEVPDMDALLGAARASSP
ncbi:MAG: redoxin domain-containing protein [Actinobacteria bacterium]|nr:redoxin domain-containing protein [Actinomycetota bacterium]